MKRKGIVIWWGAILHHNIVNSDHIYREGVARVGSEDDIPSEDIYEFERRKFERRRSHDGDDDDDDGRKNNRGVH